MKKMIKDYLLGDEDAATGGDDTAPATEPETTTEEAPTEEAPATDTPEETSTGDEKAAE